MGSAERIGCEKVEKWGDSFFPCDMPAEFHSETMGYLCGDHGMLALIAFGDGDITPLADHDPQKEADDG